jgi:hypothetical protein
MFIKPVNRSLLSMPRWQAILIVAALIVAFGVVGNSDVENEQFEVERYCEMVKIWKESNGTAGWPAYNGEGMCK